MTDGDKARREEEAVRSLLSVPPSERSYEYFADNVHARLAAVALDDGSSEMDLAVLVRQVLRRWSLQRKHTVQLKVAPDLSARLRRAATSTWLREDSSNTWLAMPWQPNWLERQGVPDGAAIAGPLAKPRFASADLPADPFFEEITKYNTYRTYGQRAACRAAVSIAPGTTLIVLLPTGAGKTEIALCLADRRKDAVCLVIVPTVALAYDFERRFREHFARRNPRIDKSSIPIAWTADTPDRPRLQAAVREGRQRILVTSPESMTRALRSTLMSAAANGRLGSIVVDEAHLVTQWGRDFRPEFRSLSHLRRDLIDEAKESHSTPPTTLLLSATLGSHELNDLHGLFGEPGPVSLIAANALRPEPDLWVADSSDASSRSTKALEALACLPRPAILYVTSPETARDWATRLTDIGYHRLALVTGQTRSDNRAQVLDALRGSTGEAPQTDLVVATSAFGLGIDYQHVRTVIHACMPETVDRWYQELGRGGRDGHASAALLLTTPADVREAQKLTTKVLSGETAHQRWTDMWSHHKEFAGRQFVDLEGNRGSIKDGSYNRRWNAQLLQGLVELDAIRRHRVYSEDIVELSPNDDAKHDWVAVERRRPDLENIGFWKNHWTPWQRKEWERSRQALSSVQSMVADTDPTCALIAKAYHADDSVIANLGRSAQYVEPEAGCGRCPYCRRNGVLPPNDPPRRPLQAWPVPDDHRTHLDELVAAADAADRLVLLTSQDHSIAAELVRELVRRGVRHVAGPMGGPPPAKPWLLVDASPVAPTDLTPYSSFVVYPPGRRISPAWLSPAVRLANRPRGSGVVDVLLTSPDASIGDSRVSRDLRAFDAYVALEILRG